MWTWTIWNFHSERGRRKTLFNESFSRNLDHSLVPYSKTSSKILQFLGPLLCRKKNDFFFRKQAHHHHQQFEAWTNIFLYTNVVIVLCLHNYMKIAGSCVHFLGLFFFLWANIFNFHNRKVLICILKVKWSLQNEN